MSDAGVRIRLSFAGHEAVFSLRDTPTTRDLVSRLPLDLDLEDFAGAEKIAYLPQRLTTDGAPAGSEGMKGDLTYYAPWGNLAIFYEDHGFATGLVSLGRVESGLPELRVLRDKVKARLEVVESR